MRPPFLLSEEPFPEIALPYSTLPHGTALPVSDGKPIEVWDEARRVIRLNPQ
jgi:hypothetical protein